MLDEEQIRTLSAAPVQPAFHLIDGESCGASDGAMMDVISPLDGGVLTTMPRGTRDDAKAAVSVARRAFDDGRWSGLARPRWVGTLDRMWAKGSGPLS